MTLPLKSFASLLRGFTHSVRSPLSVVSNDLSYFSQIIGESEVVRPLESCKEISRRLTELAICAQAPEFKYVPVRDIVRQRVPPASTSSEYVFIDLNLFDTALSELKKTLPQSVWDERLISESGLLHFEFTTSGLGDSNYEGDSCEDFFKSLSVHDWKIAWIDCVLSAHGKLLISVRGGVKKLTISMPTVPHVN